MIIKQKMQNKINHRWRDIIDSVENSNKSEFQRIKWEQNKRKRAYKNQLDGQVEEHYGFMKKRRQQKKRERTEIQNQVQEQKRKIYATRMKKMKTQQKYNTDNYQITNGQSFSEKKKDNSFREHPFEKLVDKDDQRKQKTKNNFQLQNKLNKIQLNIQRQQQMLRKQKEAISRMEFQDHVESQYKKNEENKRIHKLKFHSLKKQEKSEFNQDPEKSLEQNYVNFLNYQSKVLQKRKIAEKQCLDDVIEKINKKTQISDSSPAYIGRLSCSLDRKKQLGYIDKQLKHFKTIQDKHPKVQSSLERSICKEQKLPSIGKIVERKSSLQQEQKLSLKTIQNTKKQIKPDPLYNPQKNAKSVQKAKKIFKKYNFITGTYKTIQI